MYYKDRVYIEMAIGTFVAIFLALAAFTFMTAGSIWSLRSPIEASQQAEADQAAIDTNLVPQSVESDLEAITQQGPPLAQEAIGSHVDAQKAQRGAILPAEMALSEVQPSINLHLNSQTMGGLISSTRNNMTLQQSNWDAHQWMIITGGYQTLQAAELHPDRFQDADFELLLYFRKHEFRTAVIGKDSAETGSISFIELRNQLTELEELGEFGNLCGSSVRNESIAECSQ